MSDLAVNLINKEIFFDGKNKLNFSTSTPYRFVSIDDFFKESFLRELIDHFPSGGPSYDLFCVEDGGKPGTNYANSQPSSFPEPFKKLDELAKSAGFISLLESITGIDGLIYDPDYFGGGIRESKDKTFLPIHLDFNYHPKTRCHRRLNLLLYLNENWDTKWGGAIQVHKSPYDSAGKTMVAEFQPIANRVFIFETSETSWHGFSKLCCPSDQGRKAFSIYYYTQTRPEGQVPVRNTEYVEPWLPEYIKPGVTLSDSDVEDIKVLLKRRDDRIRHLYEIRRTFDDKYSHLWKEYEYYLAKYKSFNSNNS